MISIITAVLDSHEIVRRQALHYQKALPAGFEVIYVDDGSDPPVKASGPIKVIRTNDFRPWTEHKARNMGARAAVGDYFLMVDVDYIIPEDTLKYALGFSGDKLTFRRRFGILNEDGIIESGKKVTKGYGVKEKWARQKYIPGHRSQFMMRSSLFFGLGGYDEALDGVDHPNGGGAGQKFYHAWGRLEARSDAKTHEHRPDIFMWPSGSFCKRRDPSGLFHKLPRSERAVTNREKRGKDR